VTLWQLRTKPGNQEETTMDNLTDLDAAATSGLIDIGITTLYHEVRGSGPTVLLISGGMGDAGQWAPVAPTLAEEFTVVTYDWRGFSRSPRPEGWTATSVAELADDAAALLRALDLAPAVVVGHSGGGPIACSLVARHIGLVRHAVIYEAPLFPVVPDGKEMVAGAQAATERAMAEGGPRHAFELFIRAGSGDEADSVVEVLGATMWDRVLDNGAAFFSIALPAIAAFVPDGASMRASGVPLTIVRGALNRDTWMEAASAWLATATGADRVELPGGHGGYVTNPAELVALVRRIAR
jgi:pimeloyl-ACP methyl ester carboxylesterase